MTEILQRDSTRLWSKNRRGAVVIALQYVPSGMDMRGPSEYNPIYVGFDGEIPRELDDVLEENKQLKENALKHLGYDLGEIQKARDEITAAINLWKVPKKKWYQFWK